MEKPALTDLAGQWSDVDPKYEYVNICSVIRQIQLFESVSSENDFTISKLNRKDKNVKKKCVIPWVLAHFVLIVITSHQRKVFTKDNSDSRKQTDKRTSCYVSVNNIIHDVKNQAPNDMQVNGTGFQF